jgi:hypothetical protein
LRDIPPGAEKLEEERDISGETAVADLPDPGHLDGPVIGSAFPAGDHPVDAGEVKGRQRAKEGLKREEPGGGGNLAQRVGAPGVVVAFN